MDIGDCSVLKWTLPDKLRLYRMKQVLAEMRPADAAQPPRTSEPHGALEFACPD
ncbi:hypothetical protein [Celeribacter baekdonensis]|uniref:hypothetical protein n=1 Tax=Celeribacter baekdonensis TaxID=875171 RepID=UPI0030DBE7B4